jgi:hypothetical protein
VTSPARLDDELDEIEAEKAAEDAEPAAGGGDDDDA